MTDELEKAEKNLQETYTKVREDLGQVFVAFEDLRNAEAQDDIYSLLKKVEETVKDVRTGGLLGSGSKKHRKAREKWLELQNPTVEEV